MKRDWRDKREEWEMRVGKGYGRCVCFGERGGIARVGSGRGGERDGQEAEEVRD